MADKEKRYRKYDSSELQLALKLIKEDGKSLYFASKTTKIPWSTLKHYVSREEETARKLGRPFALSSELEVRLFNYIIEMTEMGFGLTVFAIRKVAYDLAAASGRKNFLNSGKNIASKWWWASYKERYGLSLRVPENLSAYRASMANPTILADYYLKLDHLTTELGIKDMPDRIWNCDETGMSYVVKPGRVVTAIGKKYVYNRTYAERGETHTVLACICANGTWIPPMIIFKGVRWTDILARDSLPNSLVKLSPKGWINTELFVEWFKFFISAIPPQRPIILLMDSHAAHIGPEVVELAKENRIYLLTFPAHCTHILQPLDVGVFKPLKDYWRKGINEYMRQYPGDKPNRTNFHSILNPAYVASFTSKNIINSFKKTGICPLDNNAVNQLALAPSMLTEKALTVDGSCGTEPNIISVSTTLENVPVDPVASILTKPKRPEKKVTKRRAKDSSAKCLTPLRDTNLNVPSASTVPVASCSNCPSVASSSRGSDDSETKTTGLKKKLVQKKAILKTVQNKENSRHLDDWECGLCNGLYSQDVTAKNGAQWIQCSYCTVPYHNDCLGCDLDTEEQLYFRCEYCE